MDDKALQLRFESLEVLVTANDDLFDRLADWLLKRGVWFASVLTVDIIRMFENDPECVKLVLKVFRVPIVLLLGGVFR